MQIDFQALEQALAPIAEIGQGELTFDMGATPVTLRVLLPAEELEVQRYASEVISARGEGDDPNDAVDYLDRFRIGCLAHSLVAVGNLDFRDTAFVEIGEKLENGKAVKIPKVKAMRQLVGRWSRALLTRAFRKYSELLNQVEERADKSVVFEPSDHDAEIERLEALLANLKEAKEQEERKSKEMFESKMDAALSITDTADKVADALGARSPSGTSAAPHNPVDEHDDDVTPPEPAPPVPRRTGPITPRQALPPVDRIAPAPQPAPPPPRADTSFINADDEDGMNAAMEAEHYRLVEMRRRAAQGQPPMDESSALETIHPQLNPPRRRPPHQDAADVEADLGLVEAAAQQARLVGQMDGKDVFALPAQDLDVSAPRARMDRSAVDPPGVSGSTNPRFQSPRKP